MNQQSLDCFTASCGAAGGFCLELSVTRQPAQKRQVILNQPFALVGRSAAADICLNDGPVSKRHALFQVIAGRVFFVDLCSRTGLSVNGAALRAGWLDADQGVQVGNYTVKVLENLPNGDRQLITDPLAAGSADSLEQPPMTLEFMKGDRVQAQWRLNRLLAFAGSAPWCKLRIHNDKISRVHCYFVTTPAGLWLVDLLSSNGVLVNGERVRFAHLEHGDCCELAGSRVRLVQEKRELAKSAGADVGAALVLMPTALAAAQTPNRLPVPFTPPALEQPATIVSAAIPSGTVAPWSDTQAMTGDGQKPELVALVQQFWQVQQQMFGQFQQALMQMFQMCSTMQKDPIEALGVEMKRLQALAEQTQAMVRERSVPQGATIRMAGAFPAGDFSALGGFDMAQIAARPPTILNDEDRVRTEPTETPSAGGADPSQENIHAWLSQRMAALQLEQQGWWQRTFSFLGGAPATDKVS